MHSCTYISCVVFMVLHYIAGQLRQSKIDHLNIFFISAEAESTISGIPYPTCTRNKQPLTRYTQKYCMCACGVQLSIKWLQNSFTSKWYHRKPTTLSIPFHAKQLQMKSKLKHKSYQKHLDLLLSALLYIHNNMLFIRNITSLVYFLRVVYACYSSYHILYKPVDQSAVV